jgi:hypothetical protein
MGEQILESAGATTTSYDFSRASISELWEEAQELVRANHDETGALPAEFFGPEKAAYEDIERRGVGITFAMRLHGCLAGYAVFFVLSHLHYPKIVMAYQDVLYVRPRDRGPQVLAFLDYQDRELQALGVHAILRHVKPHRDYSNVLVSLGYGRHEVSYLKVFGHGA